jgi:quinol monooxygenase YgiN
MMETDIKKIQNITKDSIRLLAFFEPKKGRGQELEKILLELVESRKEQGNISYVQHRSTESPD